MHVLIDHRVNATYLLSGTNRRDATLSSTIMSYMAPYDAGRCLLERFPGYVEKEEQVSYLPQCQQTLQMWDSLVGLFWGKVETLPGAILACVYREMLPGFHL